MRGESYDVMPGYVDLNLQIYPVDFLVCNKNVPVPKGYFLYRVLLILLHFSKTMYFLEIRSIAWRKSLYIVCVRKYASLGFSLLSDIVFLVVQISKLCITPSVTCIFRLKKTRYG